LRQSPGHAAGLREKFLRSAFCLELSCPSCVWQHLQGAIGRK
jgi:hypothetical protein